MELGSSQTKVIQSSTSLLEPITVGTFIKRCLEREVLHLEQDDASHVEGIFDLDSIGQCLHSMKPQLTRRIRVVAQGLLRVTDGPAPKIQPTTQPLTSGTDLSWLKPSR